MSDFWGAVNKGLVTEYTNLQEQSVHDKDLDASISQANLLPLVAKPNDPTVS